MDSSRNQVQFVGMRRVSQLGEVSAKCNLFFIALGITLIIISFIALTVNGRRHFCTTCDYRSMATHSQRLVSKSILLTQLLFGNIAVMLNERYYHTDRQNGTQSEENHVEQILTSLDRIHRTVKEQKQQLKMLKFMLEQSKSD